MELRRQFGEHHFGEFNGGFWAVIPAGWPSAMGTKFALVTGGNAVAQLDDKFNVKFRANRLSNWLALSDQER